MLWWSFCDKEMQTCQIQVYSNKMCEMSAKELTNVQHSTLEYGKKYADHCSMLSLINTQSNTLLQQMDQVFKQPCTQDGLELNFPFGKCATVY